MADIKTTRERQELHLSIDEFSYGEKIVLKNIDLKLKRGEFICLCGPNGAGKSTILHLLEKSVSAEKIASFLPQKEFCAWDTTVKNLILSGCFIFSKGRYTKTDFDEVYKAAETLKITPLLEKSVYEISDGEFQKARIARTLTQGFPFLILDEPCANLDFTVQSELLELFKELSFGDEKKGIIISIHDLNAASRFSSHLELLSPYSDNIDQNTTNFLVGGTPEEVITPENLERAFGKPLKVFTHPALSCPQIY